MGTGHAIAQAVDTTRAFLLDDALEGEIEKLAGYLPASGKADFYFSSGDEEGDVDDTQGLGYEGHERANERDGVFGVLRRRVRGGG